MGTRLEICTFLCTCVQHNATYIGTQERQGLSDFYRYFGTACQCGGDSCKQDSTTGYLCSGLWKRIGALLVS